MPEQILAAQLHQPDYSDLPGQKPALSDPPLGPVGQYLVHHYRHFNAAVVVDSCRAYDNLLKLGGKVIVTMAGAMSTAELGASLAPMIREGKVHGICCTAANLEEDLFRLVAQDHYLRVPNYRELSAADEEQLVQRKLCRVTDTCIHEERAFDVIGDYLWNEWKSMRDDGERLFPHEVLYRLFEKKLVQPHFCIDPAESWLMAAWEKNLPIWVPGWEDSTTGNMYAAFVRDCGGDPNMVKLGIEAMLDLADWYVGEVEGQRMARGSTERVPCDEPGIGFFQIGGGIAGDFPICVVPALKLELDRRDMPHWSYFSQISDSTTSYGSYSGAVPNEKITWHKLGPETPRFVIESDATIVAPLMFAYLLGW